jgi:hypothetical protein
VLLACATASEERAAKRAGARTVRVGIGAALGVPDEASVSFGLAGSLTDELRCGAVVDATRVVDASGTTLWEGESLGVGNPGTILAAEAIVDDPSERRRLHETTGAVAADLETGPLARAGRLVGVVRVVSDTPSRPLGRLAAGAKPDGDVAWGGVLGAFAREPLRAARAARDATTALGVLERTGRGLA